MAGGGRASHGELPRALQVDIKPYVIDEQMCDNCRGAFDDRPASHFCADPECLSYYCQVSARAAAL